MAFFDYNRDGKKDWKDNAREYYLYNKFKEEEEEKQKHKKEESSDVGGTLLGFGMFGTIMFGILKKTGLC